VKNLLILDFILIFAIEKKRRSMITTIIMAGLVATAIVYLPQAFKCSWPSAPSKPMSERERQISVIESLVIDRVNHVESIAMYEYLHGKRTSPDVSTQEIKNKISPEIIEWAAKEYKMSSEEIEKLIDRGIKSCTPIVKPK